MKPQRTSKRTDGAGLTFIEVLVGLSLMAIIMMVASSLLFSLSRVWVTLETDPRFYQHADGVAGFLQYGMHHSTLVQDGNPALRVALRTPPEQNKPLVSFRLDHPVPLFVQSDIPPPPLNAYLDFNRNDGLILYWQAEPQSGQSSSQQSVLNRQILSSKVTDVFYLYYDPETDEWSSESLADEERSPTEVVPGRIQLHFSQGGQQIVRTLYPQTPLQDVLVY